MSFKSLAKNAISTVKENSPAILTALGIAGFTTAIIVTAKQAPKAKAKLDEIEADVVENEEEITKKDLAVREIKAIAPIYAPVAAICALSTASILSAYKISTGRTAVLTTAFEVSEACRKEYAEKVKEVIGEKEANKIADKYYEDVSKENMPKSADDDAIIHTGHGDQLFMDSGSGRFFRANTNWLEECRINFSHKIFMDGYQTANDLYFEMNLPSIGFGGYLGFTEDMLEPCGASRLLDMSWDRCYMTDWGETYAIVEYDYRTHFRH